MAQPEKPKAPDAPSSDPAFGAVGSHVGFVTLETPLDRHGLPMAEWIATAGNEKSAKDGLIVEDMRLVPSGILVTIGTVKDVDQGAIVVPWWKVSHARQFLPKKGAKS